MHKWNFDYFALILILSSAFNFVYNDEIDLPCDEFSESNPGGILYEGLYCTVSSVHLSHADNFNCNVYPYYRHLVKVVKFTNCRTPYIPYMIFNYFDGIREFDISFTELEATHHGDFFKAENLMFLTISNNKITELSSSLFAGAPNISVVDFSYNHISKINSFAFAGANLMSRLDFSHNLITTIEKDVFSSLTVLDELHLDNNLIESIDPQLFATNEMLARLSLNNNKIFQLECDILSKLKYLNKLDLSMNKLQAFNTNCVTGTHFTLIIHDNQLQNLTLRRVATVHASRNQLKQIFIEDDVNNLKSLKLANNSLTNFTGIFEQLSSLETLDLSFNFVGRLNISTFAKLKNLENLYLSHTNLSNINFGTFFHQKELKALDISYNNLNKINFDVFLPYLKNLESLYLDGNNLTEMDGLTNSLFPQLSILGISNNNFNCTYLAKLLRTLKWEELELSIDPDLVHSNDTHINGITCDHNTSDSIENRNTIYNRPLNDHYDHQYNVHRAIVAILNPTNSNSNNNNSEDVHKNDTGALRELNQLRIIHAATEYREQTLETHLLTMKYLLAFISIVCLVFVVAKFIVIFKANRHREFSVVGCNGVYLQESDKHDIYQSTATMNTLQTSIAY